MEEEPIAMEEVEGLIKKGFCKSVLFLLILKSIRTNDENEYLRCVELLRRVGRKILRFDDNELENFLKENSKKYEYAKTSLDENMMKAIDVWDFIFSKLVEKETRLVGGVIPSTEIYKKVKHLIKVPKGEESGGEG